MKRVKFRKVLWGVARKAGFSPESGNFLTNQAIPVGQYINEWVSRLYSQEDWPEWTKVSRFIPDANHIVPYDTSPTTPSFTPVPIAIGRVLKVYLVDPVTTNAPVETDFTLGEAGIHCGFDHGEAVWIEYLPPPPEFTAEVWDSNFAYAKGDVVYSSNTGECYVSKVNSNLGHDPSVAVGPPPNMPQVEVPITTELVQQAAAPDLGATPQDKIIRIDIAHAGSINVPNPPAVGSLFEIAVLDENSTTLGVATHPCVLGTETLDVILTDLANQLTSALGAGWTVSADTAGLFLNIQHASNFLVVNQIGGSDAPIYFPPGGGSARILNWTQLQP